MKIEKLLKQNAEYEQTIEEMRSKRLDSSYASSTNNSEQEYENVKQKK